MLRRGAICNTPAVSTCLRFLSSNRFNDVTSRPPMRHLSDLNIHECTIGEVIDQWSDRFKTGGIPNPMESIKHIVAHVTGMKKVSDVPSIKDNRLNAGQTLKLESLCERRLLRMPIEYIIGEWNFRDISLKLVPPVFIPWPETEILVDFVLKRLNALQIEDCEMLEIGCGSGAISVSIARAFKKMKCTAIDANLNACELTMTNRDRLNVTDQIAVMHATLKPDAGIEISNDMSGAVDLNSKSFDFIVSNPPYVSRKKILKLEPERRIYEDLMAMDGGDDGLEMIKRVLHYSAKALKPEGRLFMEVDTNQPEQIEIFTKENANLKLHYEHTYKDLYNHDRLVEIVKIA